MEINNIQRVSGVNPYRKDTNGKPGASAAKKGQRKDEIEISSTAKELLSAQEGQRTDTRNQKIRDLKQSVESGAYRVDAGKIAEKLLPYLDE